MFKKMIVNYINSITNNDIIMFGSKNNIIVNENEASLINNYIKNNYEEILYGNNIKTKAFLENNFSQEKSTKIFNLLIENKKRYKNYL